MSRGRLRLPTLASQDHLFMLPCEAIEAHARPHLRVHLFKAFPSADPALTSAYLLGACDCARPRLEPRLSSRPGVFSAARPLSVEDSGTDAALLLLRDAFPVSSHPWYRARFYLPALQWGPPKGTCSRAAFVSSRCSSLVACRCPCRSSNVVVVVEWGPCVSGFVEKIVHQKKKASRNS